MEMTPAISETDSHLSSLLYDVSQQVQIAVEEMLKMTSEISQSAGTISEEIQKCKQSEGAKNKMLEEEKGRFQNVAMAVLEMLRRDSMTSIVMIMRYSASSSSSNLTCGCRLSAKLYTCKKDDSYKDEKLFDVQDAGEGSNAHALKEILKKINVIEKMNYEIELKKAFQKAKKHGERNNR